MDIHRHGSRALRMLLTILSTTAFVVAGCSSHGPSPKQGPPGTEQRFSSPKAAVDALLAACRTDDEARLVAIFGDRVKPFVSTGDPATDHERCQRFLSAANEMTRVDPNGPNTLQLVVGSDDWPFPFPLVKDDGSWRFDTAQGMQEVRRRRIGADELEAIRACRVYVLAQEERAARTRGTYSRDLVGGRGKAGLAWPSTGDENVGPVVVATDVTAKGQGPQATWRGYHYRILAGKGGMYPLVAYPVEYGWTGVMTFVVGPDGSIHQKDLGAQTAQAASVITSYTPDTTWTRVN